MMRIGDDNCWADGQLLVVIIQLVVALCGLGMAILLGMTVDIYITVDLFVVCCAKEIDGMIGTQVLDPPAR